MPWLLAIDTCGAEGGVALADTANCVTVAIRTLPGRGTQEYLLTAIQQVLDEANIKPHDLNYLAIAHGPGSFTGVRIGVAAIKGLAEALSIPVVAISRLKLLAQRSGTDHQVNAWLDAGRGDVYTGIYRNGECLGEVMLSREDARALEGEIVVGEDLLRDEGRFVGIPTAEDLVHAACTEIHADNFTDVLTLDANYLRVPDAELAQKERQ